MRTLAPSVLLILVACVGGTGTKDDPQDSEPEIVDTDGDGLSDKEEAALGTDPESEDTDGDGYDDLTESQDGDPLECMTVPSGEGNWANCKQKMSDDGLEGETWRDDGRVMMNFTITDQFGQEVELHQFYGQVVLLDFSAGWCGPCNTMAMGAEAIYQQYKDQGFITLHIMTDDWSADGVLDDPNFINDWVTEYGLTFPVGTEADEYAMGKLRQAGTYEGYIPFMIVLDREMRMSLVYTGANEEAIIAGIEEVI